MTREFKLIQGRLTRQQRLDFAAKSDQQPPAPPAAIDADDDSENFWGEPISVYTRRQAIEDGVLVQLSGPGYEGDAAIPALVAEAGIKFPVAMTVSAFTTLCVPSQKAEEKGESLIGRLWDVLFVFREYAKRISGGRLTYKIVCTDSDGKAKTHEILAVCSPGDDAEPVITLMFPWED
jgi:hypothetical protein